MPKGYQPWGPIKIDPLLDKIMAKPLDHIDGYLMDIEALTEMGCAKN